MDENKILAVIEQVKKEFESLDNKSLLVESFLKNFKKYIAKEDAEVFLGGSYAKNTFIGDSFDCDIFVRFKTNVDISAKLKKIISLFCKKNNYDYELVKGSRDYFQIKLENITFEIVPVKYIEKVEDAENIMDFSPFHVNWILKELKSKKLNNDIRLMKLFLKSARIYGAESHIQGFSGHVNDIIVLYYGGFLNTIKAISKWNKNKKTIIDYNSSYKGQDVTFFMNDSKINSPLIVVDPIMKERNASAALSDKCYYRIIDLAKEFLKNPSVDFFHKLDLNKKKIAEKYKGFVVELKIIPLDTKKDIAGAKARRAIDLICKRMEFEGFNVLGYEWDFNEKESLVFLVFESEKIDSVYISKGPFFNMVSSVENFLKKYPFAKKDNERYYVELERNFTDVYSALKAIVQEKNISDKIEGVEIIFAE